MHATVAVATQSSPAEAAYWHHSALVDAQLHGLHEGYELVRACMHIRICMYIHLHACAPR